MDNETIYERLARREKEIREDLSRQVVPQPDGDATDLTMWPAWERTNANRSN